MPVKVEEKIIKAPCATNRKNIAPKNEGLFFLYLSEKIITGIISRNDTSRTGR